MIRKDERGYVMSGIGFLLLIPVMIAIPLALSVQDQSADLPITFVKSDTVFQTLKSIQIDINDRINDFKNNNTKQTFNNPVYLAGNISKLYNLTQESVYKTSFAGTVDYLSIKPALTSTHLTMDNQSGIIPLKNGIQVTYNFVNQTEINGNSVYRYDMNVNANMTIDITKVNTGNHQENYYLSYTPISFYLNSTTNTSAFFSSLKSTLQNYNICL